LAYLEKNYTKIDNIFYMANTLFTKTEELTSSISDILWFDKIGDKINNDNKKYISNYINYFDNNLNIHNVKNWKEAIQILNSNDWNKNFWQKEENERINLYNSLIKKYSEKDLSKCLGKLTNESSKIIQKSNFKGLEKNNINYDYYTRVASGSAAISFYQTALAIISNNYNHFFISKFKLFKLGYWPLVITDNKFNIF